MSPESKDLAFLPIGEFGTEVWWRPHADVYRSRHGWLVKFDLAGVDPGDVHLHMRGSCLTIDGVRRDRSVAGHRVHSLEIAYHRFRRSIDLPCALSRATIEIDYRDGMFLVSITTEEAP